MISAVLLGAPICFASEDRHRLFEGMEFTVLDVAQGRGKALTDQAEQCKDMVAGIASIPEQLLNLQNGVVVEQPSSTETVSLSVGLIGRML